MLLWKVRGNKSIIIWKDVYHKVEDTAVGDVYFPAPATYFDNMDYIFSNMHFTDGNDDYQSNKQ